MAKVVIIIEDIDDDRAPTGSGVCKTSVDYGGLDPLDPTEAQCVANFMMHALKAHVEEREKEGKAGSLYERTITKDGVKEIQHGASTRKDH